MRFKFKIQKENILGVVGVLYMTLRLYYAFRFVLGVIKEAVIALMTLALNVSALDAGCKLVAVQERNKNQWSLY